MTARVLLLFLCVFLPARGAIALSHLKCLNDSDCKRKGSACFEEGYCTNPYHDGGCLSGRLKGQPKVRTCSSDDPPSSAAKGYCRPSAFDYTEVRVFSQDWESGLFVSWILQILLSELLDVPVSVETGVPDARVGFYDIDMPFDFGIGNDWDAIRKSNDVKDCRTVRNAESYTPCAHVIPGTYTRMVAIGYYKKVLLIHVHNDRGMASTRSVFAPATR